MCVGGVHYAMYDVSETMEIILEIHQFLGSPHHCVWKWNGVKDVLNKRDTLVGNERNLPNNAADAMLPPVALLLER